MTTKSLIKNKIKVRKYFNKYFLYYILRSRWSSLRTIGQSRIAKASIFIPIIGYTLLFGEKFRGFLKIPMENYSLAKMYYLYFGLCSISAGTILFLITCPGLIKKYFSQEEFIEKRLVIILGSSHGFMVLMYAALKRKYFYYFEPTARPLVLDNFVNPFYEYLKYDKRIIVQKKVTTKRISYAHKDYKILNPTKDGVKIGEKIRFILRNKDKGNAYYKIIMTCFFRGQLSEHDTNKSVTKLLFASAYESVNVSRWPFKFSCFIFVYLGIILVTIPTIKTFTSIFCYYFSHTDPII